MSDMFQMEDISLQYLLARIEIADDIEISQIIDSIIRRYNYHFPNWEILFLSIPKNKDQRNTQLELLLNQLKNGELK